MNAQDVKETYNLLSIAEQDTTLRRYGSFWVGPCPFCQGTDRFTLKDTSEGWRWFCRHCGDDVYHDSIDYMMKRENLGFVEALRLMGGDVDTRTPERKKKTPLKRPEIEIPSKDWQDETLTFLDEAQDTLLNTKGRQPGREYLEGRRIASPMIYVNLLGYCQVYDPKAKRNRPAIVIPHFDNSFMVTAVKLRFVDKDPAGLRYVARKGSKPIFYGMHNAFDHHETLYIVEGELNAISIMQCVFEGASVLSFGSETITHAQRALLPTLAKNYQRVIIWTDKGEKAIEAQAAIGRKCVLLKSPNGKDANDLLVAGVLHDFIQKVGMSEDVRK